ncbi:PilN family type IVB pilus formation outer membrane protein [Salmonella enterica subsp. enterica serovar Uzaramo]|uniref:PilN family type IVB pilus formation outer membrane protein n=1 Tax=Salmonella enterica TaxID=28901 RepID=A0A760AE95_SALER|nr:PilN family type IVB pilus formation outer membrane protein [Salmonella enterica]EEE9947511.1 PilN family type IVB pilus formation outer membrane protein [Salmonella enterica subsp. enterica serovar Uzaramo]EGV7463656.1 PilN family type IVB pilus formation outer membrane protein [Salmonella enterica]EHP5749148.1 PilN family type IVB pilus formation outer membrane protein [Salmonella enterica]EHP5915574.1 PilN family type IVB pilus formation outer membrane protein [Salmonella enterica]
MKNLYPSVLKPAALSVAIALSLLLGGCTVGEINKMQKQAQNDAATARRTMHTAGEKQPSLTWLDRQWINPVPIPVSAGEKKQRAPACNITLVTPGSITLQELGQRITAVCGLPVIITPDAVSQSPAEGGGETRRISGPLPVPDENGRLPLNATGLSPVATTTRPLTLTSIMWQGDVNGLLDLMATRSGLYWRMDKGRAVFYLTETRTYTLTMLNSRTSSSASVSSGTTNTMGTSGGQDNSASGDATSSQSTTVGQEYDLYADIRKAIEAMLTPEKGRYWLSASSSTLVVTDTPAVQEAVTRYVDEQNSIMNRQVSLNVRVLSVSNTRNEQFGIDWNLIYKSLYQAGATLNNAGGDIAGATSAGVSILDTATGHAARFSGSSLLIKALSEQGDVSVVTSQESTVTNLTPVPIQMADQTVYVAQSSTTTTTDVGATTSLTPGMITTGFNMTLLPLIQKSGNVQLQVSFNLSDPPTIRSFTSKDGNSYIEMPYTKLRSLSQKVNLRAGQSLVMTGFDQNNTTTSKAGTFTPSNPVFGGAQGGKNERSTLVIIITPNFPAGGQHGG